MLIDLICLFSILLDLFLRSNATLTDVLGTWLVGFGILGCHCKLNTDRYEIGIVKIAIKGGDCYCDQACYCDLDRDAGV